MRLPFSTVLLGLLFWSPTLTAQGAHPIPAGVREANKAQALTEKNIPPPTGQRSSIDPAKVGQEADELAKIAQSIPSDVASVQKGMLPKDLIEKLKHIEKLSKRLRDEIDR